MKDKIIKCPCCGEEYLPGEVLYPNWIIGQPKNIIKNDRGRIEYWEDEDLSLTETYICDKCNTPLNITVSIDYSVEVDHKKNFNEDSSTSIYSSDRISLSEN